MDYSKNYYSILGVAKDSTDKEIKKAYYKLSFVHHPDKKGDVNIFNQINESYEVLIDEALRLDYDKRSKWGKDYIESSEFLDYEFSNTSNMWDEDKLKEFKKREQLTIIIRVDDTFDGKVEYERYVTCKSCKGSGKDTTSKIQIKDEKGNILKTFDSDGGCDFCEGTGKGYNGLDCGFCYGQGKVGAKDCETCLGDKRILGKQKLSKIDFPKDEKDHKVEFMGHVSKDNPGMVGHLWLVRV